MDALSAPLQAWIGWQIGTGPLERAFSQHQRLFSSSRRGSMARQREQDIMTLMSDHDTAEVDKVLRLAIEIWKHFVLQLSFAEANPPNRFRDEAITPGCCWTNDVILHEATPP